MFVVLIGPRHINMCFLKICTSLDFIVINIEKTVFRFVWLFVAYFIWYLRLCLVRARSCIKCSVFLGKNYENRPALPRKIEKMADFCGFAAIFVPKKTVFSPRPSKNDVFTRIFVRFQSKVFCACAELRVRAIIFPRKEFCWWD